MTTTALEAPAWSADWLNGWLASLGVVRDTDLRLSFTRTPVPKPCFSHPSAAVVSFADLAAAIPQVETLTTLTIARSRQLAEPAFPRKPTAEQFAHRAVLARSLSDLSLGATVTDLVLDDELAHSPFDAAVPKGITVWERAMACRERIADPVAMIQQSAQGLLRRVKLNGLGFDARRVAVSTASDAEKFVDPVVEILAFQALPMFPTRGTGNKAPSTRGWVGGPSRPRSFTWPVWDEPLAWPAIDALLDQFWGSRPRDPAASTSHWSTTCAPFGIMGAYGSVPYRPSGSSDTTRAYAAEELWMIP